MTRLKRAAFSIVPPALAVAALALLFGPRGLAIGLAGAFLFLAWRYDNRTGTCLPLAILLLLVLGVLLLLIYLLLMMHGR